MRTEYDFSKGRRGAVVSTPKGKTRITIRLDDDVIDWFRQRVNAAGSGNYQTLINDTLKAHIHEQESRSLEDVVRRVVREELQNYRAPRKTKAT